ncbi:MAG: aminopeptidase N [Dermatophilaceae bacterium]
MTRRVPDVLTRDEAYRRRDVIPEATYDVELDLRDAPSSATVAFASRTTIRFPAVAGADTFVDLRARRLLRAELNGHPVAPSGAHRLVLKSLQPHNELVVHAECEYSRSGTGLHRFHDPVDGATYIYTQFQPFEAHRVYPCFDQPDIKARVAWTVHAPTDWVVVGNGPAERDGDTWRLRRTAPVPTYVTAVVGGPFHTVRAHHRGLPLDVHCRRSLATALDPEELFELTRQGLDFFTELFDHPYPFDQYSQVFVPEFAMGGMENAGCVTLAERFVFGSVVTDAARLSRANVLLHEMSHMWFGNLVTMRWWDDLWLNEAFATYLASLAMSRATRFGERAWSEFAHASKAWAYAEDVRTATHPVVADVSDTGMVATAFDGITYAKGASILKQLAHWVGPEEFRAGVRRFVAAHAYGNAGLGDLLAELARAPVPGERGARELSRWAHEWLTSTGVGVAWPEVQVGSDGRYVAAAVRQAQATGPTRRHRVAIGLYAGSGAALERRDRVEVELTGPATEVPDLIGRAAADLVLVNDDDLAYTRVRFDPRSATTVVDRLGDVQSSLARTLCWEALWDMTRGAELPASRWVGVVARHAEREGEVGVLQSLLARATIAVRQYVGAGSIDLARRLLASAARGALDRAAPGSDAQLTWARCLVTHEMDPRFAAGLLDPDGRRPRGLVVDAALRWYVVARLAVLGALDGDAIDAEAARDPGDLGRRRAWAARAGLPDPMAKEAAFAAAIAGDGLGLGLGTRRAILAGFWRSEQPDLLAEHAAARWVEAVERVWSEQPPAEAAALTEALFPACRVTETVVDAADRLLSSGRLTDVASQIVVEARDDAVQALRIRAADERATGAVAAGGDPNAVASGGTVGEAGVREAARSRRSRAARGWAR